jgi:hypothetical protein
MAQMIGSTRETVTRVLNRFRREKIVEIKHGTFVVKNMKQLVKAASNQPARPLRDPERQLESF